MPEEDVFNDEVEVAADVPENVVVKEYLSDIAIGDVETLDYGEDAYVTNSGTADHPVLNFGLPKGASGTIWGQLDGTLSDQLDLKAALDAKDTAIATKANANNAALTGTPTAPTATSDTNSTQIATTAFVQNAIVILRSEILSKVNKMLGRMNFSSAVVTTIYPTGATGTKSYTCPSDGYIIISGITGNSYLKINDVSVTPLIQNSSQQPYWIPVSTGDVCTIAGVGTGATITITFVPQKVEA